MRQFKLLAVGNSFTQDALYYLHDISIVGGVEIKAVNLYIGGCSLRRHWENVMSGAEEYLYELNGISTERYASCAEALREENWDFILTQQASHDSGLEETYFPYLENMVDYFREVRPGAEILLQKTWAYEPDSTHPEFPRYHCSQQEMYEKLSRCYELAAVRTGLRLIPSADVIQAVRKRAPFRYELGEKSLCRDGFHMDMIYGRYLLAALIWAFLTGQDIRRNSFLPEGAEAETVEVIKDCICGILQRHSSLL